MITPIEIVPASVPGQIKTVRVACTARRQVVFKLTNDRGEPEDLLAELPNPPAPQPVFGTSPAAVGGNVTIRLKNNAGDLYGNVVIDLTGTILAERGFVEFLFTGNETRCPGLYTANIGRFAGPDLVDTWPVQILVEPSAFQTGDVGGPLTIPELRMSLLDLNSGDGGAPFTNLLDDVEFQDQEVAYAIKRVIDLWNETPPTAAFYTPTDFPYKYWWTVGASGILLRMGAQRYRRNRLAYSAGGVSVDDQSKANEYEQIAQVRMQEFNDWMLKEKVRINMGYCWSVGI